MISQFTNPSLNLTNSYFNSNLFPVPSLQYQRAKRIFYKNLWTTQMNTSTRMDSSPHTRRLKRRRAEAARRCQWEARKTQLAATIRRRSSSEAGAGRRARRRPCRCHSPSPPSSAAGSPGWRSPQESWSTWFAEWLEVFLTFCLVVGLSIRATRR